MRAFAIVSRDKNFAFWDDDVDFTGGVSFGAVGIGDACGFVGVEAIRVFVIIYGQNALFDFYAFARETNDAFDDILVFDAWGGFTGKDFASATVGEDNDLSAMWGVFLAHKVRECDGKTIDDNAVVGHEGVFHA